MTQQIWTHLGLQIWQSFIQIPACESTSQKLYRHQKQATEQQSVSKTDVFVDVWGCNCQTSANATETLTCLVVSRNWVVQLLPWEKQPLIYSWVNCTLVGWTVLIQTQKPSEMNYLNQELYSITMSKLHSFKAQWTLAGWVRYHHLQLLDLCGP